MVGRNVRIRSYSQIEDSVIMDWVEIGSGCKIRHGDHRQSQHHPSGTQIGYDADEDRERYTVSQSGVVVLPRGPRKTGWVMTNP